MGLPRISHTAEAFGLWTYSRKLGIFNVIKFLFQFKGDQLPQTFKKDFIISKNIKNANLRKRNDFSISRVKSIKIGMLPPSGATRRNFFKKSTFLRVWLQKK